MVLGKLSNIEVLIWDIDGVLVYVEESYRKAIIETTQYYFDNIMGIKPKRKLLRIEDIHKFKLATGFNNDWEITHAAILCFLTGMFSNTSIDLNHILDETGRRGGGLEKLEETLVDIYGKNVIKAKRFWFKDLIKQIFQEMYLGEELYYQKYGKPAEFIKIKGFIRNEKPLIDEEVLCKLSERYIMGIVSGRERFEIDVTLKIHGFDKFFSDDFIVGSDDIPYSKPDPSQLIECKRRIEDRRGFIDNKNIAYIGDVPDDIIAAKRAGFMSIGVTASIISTEEKVKLKEKFKRLGADIIVDDPNDLSLTL